ncbi:DNA primase family protein [Neomegalonema perideroedes]|uniref:DNA primase family protein n=1 Tax=Neomegalonema perideroedes TaxID=217219 RepID=UPI0003685D2C|nr:phage/plasmid primase, P4 family [Neomegalonema perideroedes]
MPDHPYPEAGGAGIGPQDPSVRAKLPFNDWGNAQRLLAVAGDDLQYVVGRGWGVWNGAFYDFEAGEHAARRLAVERLGQALRDEAWAVSRGAVGPERLAEVEAEIRSRADGAQMTAEEVREEALGEIAGKRGRALLQWAGKCGNVGKVESALKLAAPHRLIAIDDLDATPSRIVTQNGVLDLDAAGAPGPEAEEAEELAQRARRWLRRHDRAMLNTRVLGCGFDPAADCPEFEAFMGLIQPNPEIRAFLQRALGQLLWGANDAQVALLFRGQGANGKSTLVNALAMVFGSYAVTCRIEMFLLSQTQSAGAPSPEEVVLPGARLYLASEPESDATLSAAKLKALTGGEPRQARALHQPPFVYTPRGCPILSFNRTPKIKGDDLGTWRRLVFIPFDVNLRELPPEKQRTSSEIAAALKAEASGILNWLLEGWRGYVADGRRLVAPPAVEALKTELRAMTDPVGEFISECTVAEDGGRIPSGDLYRVYEAWCAENQARAISQTGFGRLLTEKGVRSFKSHGRLFRKDLVWNEEHARISEWLQGPVSSASGASTKKTKAAPHADEADF